MGKYSVLVYIKITNQTQNLDYLQDVEKMYISDPGKMELEVEKEEMRLKQLDDLAKRALEIGPAYQVPATDSVVNLPRKRKVSHLQKDKLSP
jgi:hypothetical protein